MIDFKAIEKLREEIDPERGMNRVVEIMLSETSRYGTIKDWIDTIEALLRVLRAVQKIVKDHTHLSSGFAPKCIHCKLSDSLEDFARWEKGQTNDKTR